MAYVHNPCQYQYGILCYLQLGAAEQDLAKLLKLQDQNLINCLSMEIVTEGAKVIVMVSNSRLRQVLILMIN